MVGKEVGNFFRDNILRPFFIVALITSFIKIESCNNSLNEQARNQASEITKDDLKNNGLLNTLSGEIRHLLGVKK